MFQIEEKSAQIVALQDEKDARSARSDSKIKGILNVL